MINDVLDSLQDYFINNISTVDVTYNLDLVNNDMHPSFGVLFNELNNIKNIISNKYINDSNSLNDKLRIELTEKFNKIKSTITKRISQNTVYIPAEKSDNSKLLYKD